MNKEEIERLDDQGVKAWSDHDIDAFLGMLADEFVWRDTSLPEPVTSREGMREMMQGWFKAFPDMRIRTLSRVIGEDAVAAELEFTGTNTGPLEMAGVEIPPTGKSIKTPGAYFVRVKDGKVTEFSAHPDNAALLMQLGLMPSESTTPTAST